MWYSLRQTLFRYEVLLLEDVSLDLALLQSLEVPFCEEEHRSAFLFLNLEFNRFPKPLSLLLYPPY